MYRSREWLHLSNPPLHPPPDLFNWVNGVTEVLYPNNQVLVLRALLLGPLPALLLAIVGLDPAMRRSLPFFKVFSYFHIIIPLRVRMVGRKLV